MGKGMVKPSDAEDQVSRTPRARRTAYAGDLAKRNVKVATSYDEKGDALGYEPATPDAIERDDIRTVQRGMPKPGKR